MNQASALARLHEITKGIDTTIGERVLADGTWVAAVDDEGWWETSTGAEYGAARLRELEALIVALT